MKFQSNPILLLERLAWARIDVQPIFQGQRILSFSFEVNVLLNLELNQTNIILWFSGIPFSLVSERF